MKESIFFNLDELSTTLKTLIKSEPQEKKQKSIIKLVKSLKRIFI